MKYKKEIEYKELSLDTDRQKTNKITSSLLVSLRMERTYTDNIITRNITSTGVSEPAGHRKFKTISKLSKHIKWTFIDSIPHVTWSVLLHPRIVSQEICRPPV